jgi:hypothetical protein
MNPEKLAQFSENKLIPSVADKYLRQITHDEMPCGLKIYMKYELFPRIHLKVGRGISLSTAHRWMHREGFQYILHKKGLYFDGHDQPNIVAYHQNHFLPMMKKYEPCIVRYNVGDIDTELIQPQNYVGHRLIVCAQDEMTTQADDSQGKSWVLVMKVMSPLFCFFISHTSKGLHAHRQYHRLKTVYSQIQIPYVLK